MMRVWWYTVLVAFPCVCMKTRWLKDKTECYVYSGDRQVCRALSSSGGAPLWSPERGLFYLNVWLHINSSCCERGKKSTWFKTQQRNILLMWNLNYNVSTFPQADVRRYFFSIARFERERSSIFPVNYFWYDCRTHESCLAMPCFGCTFRCETCNLTKKTLLEGCRRQKIWLFVQLLNLGPYNSYIYWKQWNEIKYLWMKCMVFTWLRCIKVLDQKTSIS